MSDFSDILNMDELAGLAGAINLPAFSNSNVLSRAGNTTLAMPMMDDALLDRLTLLKDEMLMLEGGSTALWMAIENLNPVLQENNAALNKLSAMPAAVPQVFNARVAAAPSLPVAAKTDTEGDDKDSNYTPAIDQSLDSFPTTIWGAVMTGLDSTVIDNGITERFQGLGVPEKTIAQMQALAAQEQIKILGTSEPMNFSALYNFANNLGSAGEAEADASSLLKASLRVNSISGEHERDIDADASDMSKIDAIPMNLFDPKTHKLSQAKADVLNNGVANIVLATGGKVSTDQISYMAHIAGPNVITQMTSEADFAALEPLLLALKGGGVGNTLDALGQVFNPKDMSGREASALQHLGISQASLAKNQTPTQWAAWFETVLDPAMVAHGYKTGAQQKTFLDQVFKGSKGFSGLVPLLDKLDEFENDHLAYQKTAADKTNSYDYIASHNMPLQINAFAVGIEAFLRAIAKASTPQTLTMLNDLTRIVDGLTGFVNKNPDFSEAIGAFLVLDLLYATIGKYTLGVLKYLPKGDKSILDLLGLGKEAEGSAAVAAKATKVGTQATGATTASAEAGAAATDIGVAGLLSGPVGWLTLGVMAAGAGIYEGYKHRGALNDVLHKLENYMNGKNEGKPGSSGQRHVPAGEVRFGIHEQDDDDTSSTGGSTGGSTGTTGHPGSGASASAPVAFPPSVPDILVYDKQRYIGYSSVYGGMYGLDDELATDQPWFARRSALIEAVLASTPQEARAHNQSHGLDDGAGPVMSRSQEIELLADAIGSVLSASSHYHGAVPVYIINAGDLHNATVRAISSELEGVQHGPTGYDGSFSAPLPSAHW